MIIVTQNQATRKWGFRIIESTESDNKFESIQRTLYEDTNYNSPQEAFQILILIKKAFEQGSYKIIKDSFVYGYEVYDDRNNPIMGESGWMTSDDTNTHISSIKRYIHDEPKMAQIPSSKMMSIGDNVVKPTINNNENTSKLDWTKLREEIRLELMTELEEEGSIDE